MNQTTLTAPAMNLDRQRSTTPERAMVESLLRNRRLEEACTHLRALVFGPNPRTEDILRLAELYVNVGLIQLATPLMDAVRSVEPQHPGLRQLAARILPTALFRTEWQLHPGTGGLVTRHDVEEFFSCHYDIHDWYFGAHFHRLVETLMRTAAYLRTDSRVLEVGSNGSFPLLLWKMFGVANLSAVDGLGGFLGYQNGQIIREEASGLEFSLPIAKVNLELENLPFPDNSQDIVLCYETLEHFREDPMQFMVEANRVLKPDGLLVMTTPNSSSLRAVVNVLHQWTPYLYSVYVRGDEWRGMAHIKEYAVREMQTLFEKAGFAVASHQTFSPYQHDVEGRVDHIKDALLKLGLSEPLSGSTHFIVGRKNGQPTCRTFEPLYNRDEPWTGGLPN